MSPKKKARRIFDGACLINDHDNCPGDCDCQCHDAETVRTGPLTVDAHVDTLWVLSGLGMQKTTSMSHMNLRFGGLDRVVLALYLSDPVQDRFGEVKSWDAIERQLRMAQMQFPDEYIALEGGRALGTDPIHIFPRLKMLAEAGLKYLTLTHNKTNLLCGSSTDTNNEGLSRLGYDIVEECNDIGVLIDVSHASDATIADVIYCSRDPIIASHSGCRALVPHVRNLTDTQIVQIGLSRGMVCVPFARKFVGTAAGIADAIDHICQLTGSYQRVGIGSDIDGAALVEGITGFDDWSTAVVDGLAKRGYRDDEVAAIAGGNLLRLFGEWQNKAATPQTMADVLPLWQRPTH